MALAVSPHMIRAYTFAEAHAATMGLTPEGVAALLLEETRRKNGGTYRYVWTRTNQPSELLTLKDFLPVVQDTDDTENLVWLELEPSEWQREAADAVKAAWLEEGIITDFTGVLLATIALQARVAEQGGVLHVHGL